MVIDAMKQAGMVIEMAQPSKTVQKLQNEVYVISGTLSTPRAEIKQLLEQHGAKVSNSITKKTTALIVGDKPGSKLKKAEDLGVEIIDETQLQQRL